MKAFAALYAELDATTSTRRKLAAMAAHFRNAPPADAAWAAWFLAGARPRRLVPMAVLRETACRLTALPDWLFDESYQAVGDLAETIALLLPPAQADDARGLDAWMRETLLPLRGADPQAAGEVLAWAWARLDAPGRFVLNKLLTGGFRVGVARQLVVRALAQAFEVDERLVAQRFVGFADPARPPDAAGFAALAGKRDDAGRDVEGGVVEGCEVKGARGFPYPFFLAHPLSQPPESLGARGHWLAEWKWDGIRAQLVRRDGGCWLWSRGEELITDRFPEIEQAATALPEGSVVDGELLCWKGGEARPMPFASLQRRIGRLTPSVRLMREAPVVLLAYDLLEAAGRDLRSLPFAERRHRLDALLAASPQAPDGYDTLMRSPLLDCDDWAGLAAARARAREAGAEGLMLKRRDAPYGIGRTKSAPEGDWWKWKLDPMSADCVLVYAQRGHGRRASLYTDYTFAVWSDAAGAPERRLVPVAKAYSGLTDAEIREVDAEIRRNTVEKFGPVRSVRPTMVFEIGFEGIARSTRHRSGLAVRFPRILRRRPDKTVDEADTLAAMQGLLDATDVG